MSRRSAALAAARCAHTAIYGVMAVSTLAILYVGISGRFMPTLWIFLPLLAAEIAVFMVNGLKCPLTAVVDRLSDAGAHVPDTYLPERLTRHTLAIFGPVLPVAFMLLAARWAELLGEGMSS